MDEELKEAEEEKKPEGKKPEEKEEKSGEPKEEKQPSGFYGSHQMDK